MYQELYPGMSVSGIGVLSLDRVARDGGLKAMQDLLSGELPAARNGPRRTWTTPRSLPWAARKPCAPIHRAQPPATTH